MADWDAGRYHEISTPQQEWGRRVLDRLALAGTEQVLDIGCGTGRLTEEIAARLPHGRVVGLDRSASMLETAASWLRTKAPRTSLVLADGAALPFRRAFDAIFSGATFHWIHDHAALFRSIITALRPGGRLVAQCGGGPNLALLYARAEGLMRDPRFARYFEQWTDPTYFADVETTRRRLTGAGFVEVEVSLEEAPTPFDGPEQFREFIAKVCVRHQVALLPGPERQSFLRDLTVAAAGDPAPFTLDYWRLNISGRRPA
jgi:trans-aconitate 2-methyltransferase